MGVEKEGRNAIEAVHTYETLVTIAGEPATIHVIVREALDGKRFYDHYEADVEAAGGMSGERIGTDSIQPTPATLPNAPGKSKIAQQIGQSNKQSQIPGTTQTPAESQYAEQNRRIR